MDNRKRCWKYELSTSKLDDEIFDLNDHEVVAELKRKHFYYLYRHYLNLNNKEEALTILFEKERRYFNQSACKEIVHVYLYFNDYKGALEYIEKAKLKVPEPKPYEFLIKIHLLEKNKGFGDEEFFNLVKEGLTMVYDRRFIKIAIEFYKFNCKECIKSCFKEKLSILQEIIQSFHYADLKYSDAKFLYYTMPSKALFLKKMVQTNPKINRKFYLEYANIYGFVTPESKQYSNKQDITKILKAKFRTCAFKIALFFGWIDESQRHSFEKYLAPYSTTINRKAEWNFDDQNIFHFKDDF